MRTKNVILISIVGVVLLVTGVFLFAAFWVWRQAHDIAQYLPPAPAAAGIVVKSSSAKVFSHFATRSFTFTAAATTSAAEAAKLFEPQLDARGEYLATQATVPYWRQP